MGFISNYGLKNKNATIRFYSYIHQFRWGIAAFFCFFLVLINYVFPKFLYRESSGVLKREGAIDTSYSWEEEEIIDFLLQI